MSATQGAAGRDDEERGLAGAVAVEHAPHAATVAIARHHCAADVGEEWVLSHDIMFAGGGEARAPLCKSGVPVL